MPKKLENCVKSVRKSGKSESSSYAICNSQMNKSKKKYKKSKR